MNHTITSTITEQYFIVKGALTINGHEVGKLKHRYRVIESNGTPMQGPLMMISLSLEENIIKHGHKIGHVKHPEINFTGDTPEADLQNFINLCSFQWCPVCYPEDITEYSAVFVPYNGHYLEKCHAFGSGYPFSSWYACPTRTLYKDIDVRFPLLTQAFSSEMDHIAEWTHANEMESEYYASCNPVANY